MNWIMTHLSEISMALAAFMTFCSIIVGLTPTPRDDEALKKVQEFLRRFSILKPAEINPFVKKDRR